MKYRKNQVVQWWSYQCTCPGKPRIIHQNDDDGEKDENQIFKKKTIYLNKNCNEEYKDKYTKASLFEYFTKVKVTFSKA